MRNRAAFSVTTMQIGLVVCAALQVRAAREPVADGEEQTRVPAKVRVQGTVVDDVTGVAVPQIVVQNGKFEPDDPDNVTWGYGETHSGGNENYFSTTIRWPEGWTARILADGYLPQPVLTAAPPPGKEVIDVVIRLKRGKPVKGRVLDSAGQPVKGAAVFAVGPRGLNLARGKAWKSVGESDEEDPLARPARTDAEGRFELHAGTATIIAVSSKALDAWPAPIPEVGEAVVRLPAPATVRIRYDIEGADPEARIGYQFLSHRMPGFKGLESSRDYTVKNGGALGLATMTPGKYQFWRERMHRIQDFGTGAMLDRQFVEIKSGESRTIDFVRAKGARVGGKVTWEGETDPAGVVVSVNSMEEKEDPFDGHKWDTTYASVKAAADGTFFTERIAPGRYKLQAEGYLPLTDEQKYGTGIIMPALTAETEIEVPESGELKLPDLKLSQRQ